MTNKIARRGRLAAYKLVLAQAAMAVVCSVFFFTVWGVQFGYSAFAGGLIAVLPNFVFVTLAFSHSGASQTDKVLKNFYWGEAVKLLLTIGLFSLAFSQLKAAFTPIFVGYVLCLMVHWAAPLYFKQS
ncbi:F0F1 ATP synthase subunit I [Parashewanella spongiae]|uniref:F0F1 ATP synthase subunit I n=1 Tax=Parashewanella spongiae TaxID=342950 RepID=A0A3A6UF69_9GAMM|nr:ATP synthase subunit I [Parashewanella spongiae]MCL1078039.1 ATP synthase subunit I [Parashewanella spongiae]RJY17442.1 F0F1 ATP synthase subunit I [Parashewanella spongiae]